MQIIREVNERYGMTVIMVLHDINHALQYADEAVVLANHHIVSHGRPDEVISVGLLADVFGVRAERFVNKQGRIVLSPAALVYKN